MSPGRLDRRGTGLCKDPGTFWVQWLCTELEVLGFGVSRVSLTILQGLVQGTWRLEAQEGSHLDLCHASENAWGRKKGGGCYPPYLGPEHCALLWVAGLLQDQQKEPVRSNQ